MMMFDYTINENLKKYLGLFSKTKSSKPSQ